MTQRSRNRRSFGSSPFDQAKATVESIYTNIPCCPICGSEDGYHFSGWLHEFVECRNCKAKWEVCSSAMRLVRQPVGHDYVTLEKLLDKKVSFDAWKRLRTEGSQTIPPDANITSVISCSDCGHSNPFLNSFCENCGKALKQEFSACPKCHQLNSTQANFCKNCGADLREDQTRIY
jgi:uncharacterized protein (DUF983 family)/ribosomal protein L40E